MQFLLYHDSGQFASTVVQISDRYQIYFLSETSNFSHRDNKFYLLRILIQPYAARKRRFISQTFFLFLHHHHHHHHLVVTKDVQKKKTITKNNNSIWLKILCWFFSNWNHVNSNTNQVINTVFNRPQNIIIQCFNTNCTTLTPEKLSFTAKRKSQK